MYYLRCVLVGRTKAVASRTRSSSSCVSVYHHSKQTHNRLTHHSWSICQTPVWYTDLAGLCAVFDWIWHIRNSEPDDDDDGSIVVCYVFALSDRTALSLSRVYAFRDCVVNMHGDMWTCNVLCLCVYVCIGCPPL